MVGRFLFSLIFLSFSALAEDAPKPQILINPNAAGNPNTPATQLIVPGNTSSNSNPASSTPTASTPSIPVPLGNTSVSYGKFRNKDGTTKVSDMMLERFKESVVRITVRDQEGNPLSQAMGVAVGKDPTYIATSLSILLGNALQWADQVDIQHHAGNHYGASLAYINEQLDLALLAPENMPQNIPFVKEDDERSGIGIYTIGFDDKKPVATAKVDEEDSGEPILTPKIIKGNLAAVNPNSGSLSVSKELNDNAMSGTAIINMQGELVGMLLPNGKGVLGSFIAKDIEKAKKTTPFAVRLLGAIMGRGVLVDPTIPDAFKTIEAAMDAIKKGDAPKANPKLFVPAKTNELAPREADRIVLKIMPGVYKIKNTISFNRSISFTGSGPKSTLLLGSSPNEPVIKIEGASNVSITGFRIVPAAMQLSESATVLVSRSSGVAILGNLLEAKGGTALQVQNTAGAAVVGNSFPKGQSRALVCKNTNLEVQANSFLGSWPQAISTDKDCNIKIERNLFMENQLSVALSSQAKQAEIRKNTFLRNVAAIRFFGQTLTSSIEDNIFSGGVYSIMSALQYDPKKFGRNHSWKNIAVSKGKQVKSLDMVKVEPVFENPDLYDYRPKIRSAVAGSGGDVTKSGLSDLGAYQRTDFLGKYTSYFIHTLEAATGLSELAIEWGFEK